VTLTNGKVPGWWRLIAVAMAGVFIATLAAAVAIGRWQGSSSSRDLELERRVTIIETRQDNLAELIATLRITVATNTAAVQQNSARLEGIMQQLQTLLERQAH
jgi:hypothetical protein